MFSLESILVLLSVVVIGISTWGFIYFAGRIYTAWKIRRDLGDMPSADEIAEHYKQINARNGGVDQHPR